MEYVYGALLLHAAGKTIDEAGVTNVLKAAGISADAARVKALTSALDGVDIEAAIKSAAAVAVAPAAAPAGAPGKADERKKEEKKPEVTEEEAAAGLGALFG